MSGFRRKKRNYSGSSQNKYLLITFLSLVVLFETILLLFLLPKFPSGKSARLTTQKKTKIETRVQPQKTSEQKSAALQKTTLAPIVTKTTPKKIKGKIAIVIDDWGYNTNNLSALKEINLPLTLAILPFSAYSRQVAEYAHRNNYEVIIHMPMEPDDKEKLDLEPKTLMINMDSYTIKKILNEALERVPYAKGINNHMGSLATKNRDFFITVFNELKKNDLYFLDSYVIPESVCYDVSRSIGIKFAKRSVFLDNDSSVGYIRGQLMKLIKEADETGQAIGIGHDRKNTIKVLKELLPRLAEEGYRFVFVSEIVK